MAATAEALPLATLLAEKGRTLCFNMVEVGARPIEAEPFHALLDVFPDSRLTAFEIDPALCEELNRTARPGVRFHAAALGRGAEERTVYETAHPACTSLYEPDARLADLYVHLDVMRVRATSKVKTVGLQAFARQHDIGPVDFIKMDVQGAELDVLQGAGSVLSSVLAMVLEAEFVPLYKGQPLFADVDAYLRERDFMFHKFLLFAGRLMKPLMMNDPNAFSQLMWCDVMYTCDLLDLAGFGADQLLKLAVLLDVYGSPDAAHYAVAAYDALAGSALAPDYLERIVARSRQPRT